MQPEAKLVKRTKDYIIKRGGRVVKIHGDEFQEVGVSDLLVCYKGRFLALEAKTAIGRPSRIQQHFLKSITEAGGIAMVFRSIRQIEVLLDMIDKEVR